MIINDVGIKILHGFSYLNSEDYIKRNIGQVVRILRIQMELEYDYCKIQFSLIGGAKLGNTVKTIPIESESRVLYQNQCYLDRYNICYEVWRVNGIHAECIIFSNEDVSDLDDEKLEQVVKKSVWIDSVSAITISRSTESTFVIFNLA